MDDQASDPIMNCTFDHVGYTFSKVFIKPMTSAVRVQRWKPGILTGDVQGAAHSNASKLFFANAASIAGVIRCSKHDAPSRIDSPCPTQKLLQRQFDMGPGLDIHKDEFEKVL
jgi:hypothetical protein